MTNAPHRQRPSIEARAAETLYDDGVAFKDLNKNGKIDIYEDWRRPVAERVADLLSQMTLEEKAGMLMIDQLNAGLGGVLPDLAAKYVEEEKMTRFIFRNTVTNSPSSETTNDFFGAEITPYQAAQFTNALQELCESTRLGIPALFKSNPRIHYEHRARGGLDASVGAFSAWPKEAGLAATRDMELIAEFAQTVAREWVALGIRGMYGYCLDLTTEPRWFRATETFTEDADLASEIATTLVENLQGKSLNSKSVAVTMKHFPGGGPQEGGGDPHFEYGKNQAYPSDNFDYHFMPFVAAIEAGVSSIMPYYGVPVGQKYLPNDVGMSFSKGIVTELLRDKLGFEGNVNSDTGIVTMMPWGVEDKSVAERIAMAIEAGVDVLSGFNSNEEILGALNSGGISEKRVDQSVVRLLTEQFQLGLFENPYVDPNRAAYVLGSRTSQRKTDLAQRKSIVLLQNPVGLLPLQMPTPKERPDPLVEMGFRQQPKAAQEERVSKRIYVMGMDADVVGGQSWGDFDVVSGDYDPENGEARPIVPEGTDYAILRVIVGNNSKMGGGFLPVADPDELDLLAFSDMAKSNSWTFSPTLEDINSVMAEIGEDRTILAIRFRQPFVLDEASGLRNAGSILATFGVNDAAIMDVVTGKFEPVGKLPFALADSAEAIVRQHSDSPGYQDGDTLFPFGHGLS